MVGRTVVGKLTANLASVPILKFLFNFGMHVERSLAESLNGSEDIVCDFGPSEGFWVGAKFQKQDTSVPYSSLLSNRDCPATTVVRIVANLLWTRSSVMGGFLSDALYRRNSM